MPPASTESVSWDVGALWQRRRKRRRRKRLRSIYEEGDNDEGNNKFDGKRSSGRIPWTIYNPPEPYVPDVFTLTFPPASPCVSMFIASCVDGISIMGRLTHEL